MTDGSAVRTFWCGVLHAIGAFDLSALTDAEKVDIAGRTTWFWLGEVSMAGVLAGIIAVPAGIWFAGRTELSLAFIGSAVLFLPLFVFLPRLIRYAMKADTDAVLEAFGKNEQIKKVFWVLFTAIAGIVLVQVVDPKIAQEFAGIITGIVP
jgi:hypothetical protein